MATYKVIQDIEAEDTLIGWMTPRQAIYAAIVLVSGFVGFLMTSAGAWWLAIFLLPHMILFTVLAGPFVHDQPSEIWLLAKIQFFLKPRRRIWNQSGIKQLVTVTVPKKIERRLTDGLSQGEVKSRLQALANTIDSRGWAVKNVNVNLYAQPSYATAGIPTDRLLDAGSLPQEVPSYEVNPQDDILDERSNPTAQNLQRMIDQSSQQHRQQAVAQMQKPTGQQPTSSTQQADYWFLNNPTGQPSQNYTAAPAPAPATVPDPTADESALMDKVMSDKHKRPHGTKHLRTIAPLSDQPAPVASAQPPVSVPDPAVMQLAQNNDLNVSTIARQAQKSTLSDDEVVVSLR